MLTDFSCSALFCLPELGYMYTRVSIHAKPLGFIDMAMHLRVCSYINRLFNGCYKTQSRFMGPWVCTGVCIYITLYSGSAKRDMLTGINKI